MNKNRFIEIFKAYNADNIYIMIEEKPSLVGHIIIFMERTWEYTKNIIKKI